MKIVEYIENESGAENIDISRQKTNEKNLSNARELWKKIILIDEDKCPNYKNFKSSDRELNRVVQTIPNRLKKNFIHYGLSSPEDISWKHIKRMAKEYLEASEWLQISFCKDSTRQGIDERVQRKMLNFHLNDLNYDFTKCLPSLTLYKGKLLQKDEYKKLDPRKTRKDIDSVHKSNGINIWIFQKYAKDSGGHQDNVIAETQHFLNDADEFFKIGKKNNYFIAQLDGKFIESKLLKFRENIIYTSNVFAGNTQDVIKWLRNIKNS